MCLWRSLPFSGSYSPVLCRRLLVRLVVMIGLGATRAWTSCIVEVTRPPPSATVEVEPDTPIDQAQGREPGLMFAPPQPDRQQLTWYSGEGRDLAPDPSH